MEPSDDLSGPEREAANRLAALRRRDRKTQPIPDSFKDRMASATIDPSKPAAEPAVDDASSDFVIFRP